jgi:hypothetical protein
MRPTKFWLCVVLCAPTLFACSGKNDGHEVSVRDAGSIPWLGDPDSGGFQLALPNVTVPAGQQRAFCLFAEVPDVHANGDKVWISRWQIAMDPHAYELVVYRVKTVVTLDGEPGTLVSDGACLNPANWADWVLVANSQQRISGEEITDYDLPEGVGHAFEPHERLMLQVRFVNNGTSDVSGRAGINFHGARNTPSKELGTLRASMRSMRVCQTNPTPTFGGTCQIFGSATVIAANGQQHSRGKDLSIYAWDGTSLDLPPDADRFYESKTWDHPPMSQGLSRALPENGGIRYSCGYQWSEPPSPVTCEDVNIVEAKRAPGSKPDCCYTFGDDLKRDEECSVFVYYFPKADNVNCY